MTNKLTNFFLIAFLLIKSTLSAEIQNEHVVRAAIDIGMGGPKLQISEIDLGTNKIVKTLYSHRYYVNFYEDVSKNDDNRLSDEVMIQGIEAFGNAIEVAHSFQAEGIVAIATASLRAASNGSEFANIIQDRTGVKVHIVDQGLEGKLAFQAVLSKIDVAPEDLIVWDIGGGSIQFIGLTADGSFLVDCGKKGVGAFNNYIISNIQCRNTQEHMTPNPMSASNISQAEIYAQNLSQEVDDFFKEKLRRSTTKVVGAGNAFGYGISAIVGKKSFSLVDITTVVQGLAGKTDEDFGGEFAFCEGSNTILALGFMKNLGIKQIHIANINNADGAIVYQPFWNNNMESKQF